MRWRALTVVVALLATMTIAAVNSQPAQATHFRYKDISWKRVSGTTVEFRMKVADRRSFYGFPGPSEGTPWNEPVNFGDGTSGTLSGQVVSVNAIDDWFIAEVKGRHTYAGSGPYSVVWESCCTLSTLRNSPDSSLRSRTVVDLNGGNNASPVTSVSPVLGVPRDVDDPVRTWTTPAFDPDGDNVSYRLASSSESLLSQPPGLSIDPRTGVVTWDTTGKADGLWITTVIAADGRGAETQITHLLKLGGQVTNAPRWTGETPRDRFVFDVRGDEWVPVTFRLEATDPDGQRVTITSLGLPDGVTCNDTANPAIEAVVTCYISPTGPGFALATFNAQDPDGNSAGIRNFVIGSGRYVSMGDSYQSGEGAGRYEAGTDTADNKCHRSLDSYPYRLAESTLAPRWATHVACSGATTADLRQVEDTDGNDVPWNEGAQYDALERDVSLVTIGIGGNDVGFGPTLTECAKIWAGRLFGALWETCESELGDDIDAAMDRFAQVELNGRTRLQNVIAEIRGRAPIARILVVGYPRFLPNTQESYVDCLGLVPNSDIEWINSLLAELNDLVRRAATSQNAEYVDVEDALDGHDVCQETGDSWIHRTPWESGLVHPTADAHEAIYLRVLDRLARPRPGQNIGMVPQGTHRSTAQIDAGTRWGSFGTTWPGSDVVMTLISPSGRVIDRSTVAPDVVHDLGPTFEHYLVVDPEPGTWTVELFGADVADGEPAVLNVEQVGVPNRAPVASIDQTTVGAEVTLDGSASSDPDGTIVDYTWYLDDTTIASGPNVRHVYTEPGRYRPVLVVTDDQGRKAFASGEVLTVGDISIYGFEGFEAPIENVPLANLVTAGRTVPVRWRLTDSAGTPVSDPASFVSLTARSRPCEAGETADLVEETTSNRSGLLYHGDGSWQFNWKVPQSYAGSCKTMVLTLADGTTQSAHFRFR